MEMYLRLKQFLHATFSAIVVFFSFKDRPIGLSVRLILFGARGEGGGYFEFNLWGGENRGVH